MKGPMQESDDELESLLRYLLAQGEGTLIEFKGYNPFEDDIKDDLRNQTAKAVVSLSNSAILEGFPAYLVIGIADDRSFVGVPFREDDRKIFFDRIEGQAYPIPKAKVFARVGPTICGKVFGQEISDLCCYIIEFPPEEFAPCRFSSIGKTGMDASEGGALLIRRGSKNVKPDVVEMLTLFAKCEGAAEAIRKHHATKGRDILSQGSEQASQVAALLHARNRRKAAKLAYTYLINTRGPKLGTLIWRSPSALFSLIEQDVNPFLWYCTARGKGYSLRVKLKGVRRRREEKRFLFGIEAQAEAWDKLSAAFKAASKSSGLTEEPVLAGSSLQYSMAQTLKRRSLHILSEEKKKDDRIPYHWFYRLMVSHLSTFVEKPPEGWSPTPSGWVEGLVYLIWEKVGFFRAPTAVNIILPLLSGSWRTIRVWWGIFAQVGVFSAVDSPDLMRFSVETTPWGQEATDSMWEGKISMEEAAGILQTQPVRISLKMALPVIVNVLVLLSIAALSRDPLFVMLAVIASVFLLAFYAWIKVRLNRRAMNIKEELESDRASFETHRQERND